MKKKIMIGIKQYGSDYEAYCFKKETIIGDVECLNACKEEMKKCEIWLSNEEFDKYYNENKICQICRNHILSRALVKIIYELNKSNLISPEFQILCCDCMNEKEN